MAYLAAGNLAYDLILFDKLLTADGGRRYELKYADGELAGNWCSGTRRTIEMCVYSVPLKKCPRGDNFAYSHLHLKRSR